MLLSIFRGDSCHSIATSLASNIIKMLKKPKKLENFFGFSSFLYIFAPLKITK